MFAGYLADLDVTIEDEGVAIQEPETQQELRFGEEETEEYYLALAEGFEENGCQIHSNPLFEWKLQIFGKILEHLLKGKFHSVKSCGNSSIIN